MRSFLTIQAVRPFGSLNPALVSKALTTTASVATASAQVVSAVAGRSGGSRGKKHKKTSRQVEDRPAAPAPKSFPWIWVAVGGTVILLGGLMVYTSRRRQ